MPFFVGNMLDLSFPSQSFDRVFCLWASFNHLLKRNEQTRALREMLRVLFPGGLMFLEVNDGESKRVQATVQARGRGLDGRIANAHIGTFLSVEDVEIVGL